MSELAWCKQSLVNNHLKYRLYNAWKYFYLGWDQQALLRQIYSTAFIYADISNMHDQYQIVLCLAFCLIIRSGYTYVSMKWGEFEITGIVGKFMRNGLRSLFVNNVCMQIITSDWICTWDLNRFVIYSNYTGIYSYFGRIPVLCRDARIHQRKILDTRQQWSMDVISGHTAAFQTRN